MELPTGKIYLRYFYKNYKSDYILNDSVTFSIRRISPINFHLDKFVYKKKEWTKVYKIEPAMDSLRVTTRAINRKGNSKFIYTKEKYYNPIEITEPKQ